MYVGLAALAIVAAIFLGWKYEINIGLTALVFAILIGCFGLELQPEDIKNLVPIKVIFPITSITLFYGFAQENGSLLKAVYRIIYRFRKHPGLIPVILFVLCVLLGMCGLDAASITIIVSPIAMNIVTMGRLPVLPAAVATLLGATVGSDYVFSTGGTIMRGLIEKTATVEEAVRVIFVAYLHELVLFAVIFSIVFLLSRTRGGQFDLPEQEPFDRTQKLNLLLIVLFVLLAAGPFLLGSLTGLSLFRTFSSRMDIGLLALIFSLIASFLGLGDVDHILKTRVPWKTMFMVSGITILIGVATRAGMTDLLTSVISNHLPVFLVPPIIALIAGIMSIFSSAISVVVPTLFPLLPAISAATGVPDVFLYTAVSMGASITGMSPFSTGGCIMIANCMDECQRDRLVFHQILVAVTGLGLVVLYCFLFSL